MLSQLSLIYSTYFKLKLTLFNQKSVKKRKIKLTWTRFYYLYFLTYFEEIPYINKDKLEFGNKGLNILDININYLQKNTSNKKRLHHIYYEIMTL